MSKQIILVLCAGVLPLFHLAAGSERRGQVIKTSPRYEETYRPQFHFTPQKGWTNDPNGLVCYSGEYHLFFQHNPFGTQWGNMTWGHAISPDLVHWKQLANALEPDSLGTMFSGSAVVDWGNTTGFQTGKEKALVAIYTAAGGTSEQSKGQPFTQCIAYSNDRGRTWTKYSGNPVLKNVIKENRDPKVVWHAPTRSWIMALFLDGNEFALFRSPNLKEWELLQKLTMPGCGECPDFFEMRVKGETGKKWVFTAANGKYMAGDFDGKKFSPETAEPIQVEFGGNCYAVQTYSDIPAKDGRRIQIGWMNGGKYPEMPFNQQMTIPCELTLRRTAAGLRLFKEPVKELQSLRIAASSLTNSTLTVKGTKPIHVGAPVEIRAEIRVAPGSEIVFSVQGEAITYSSREQKLTALGHSAPMKPRRGTISVHILADRTSMEVFGNEAEVALSSCYLAQADNIGTVSVSGPGEAATVLKMQVYGIKSIWK